jgi:hypothetical protein
MSNNLEQRVENLEKIIKDLQAKSCVKIRKNLGIGDTFDLAGLKWKILDITEKGYMCLSEKLDDNMTFDSNCNNWVNSDLRKYLNGEFFNELAAAIGADNIVEFKRDLLSMDGQTEYGKCIDNVSLLNLDEYRKYRNMIPKTEDYWWWLITPWSTPSNDYHTTIAVVSPSGDVYDDVYNNDYGVRPFCIFSSSIFESGE